MDVQGVFLVPQHSLCVLNIELGFAAEMEAGGHGDLNQAKLAWVFSDVVLVQCAPHHLRGRVRARDEQRLARDVRGDEVSIDSHCGIARLLSSW